MHIAQVRIRQASPQASEVALDHALRAELGHVRLSLAGSQPAGAGATGVDLRRVDLSGADLTRARFEGCDLRRPT